MHRLSALACLIYLAPAMALAGFAEADAALLRGDYAAAAREYQQLADAGDAEAQLNLSLMYHDGNGVVQNDAQALTWARRAAEQGYAKGQYTVGLIYDTAQGVPQNYAEALKWYRLAAAQGFADAQYNLGFLYARGQGVPDKDYVQAYLWWSFAASNPGTQDREIVLKNIGVLDGLMTPAQVAEAQRLVHEWKPSKQHQ